ncbi:MAG TPA: hypothetical protein VH682_14265 [Gemmataceae bacterium]|jgi:hypothetical protein
MIQRAALSLAALACLTVMTWADVPPSPNPHPPIVPQSAKAPLVLTPGAKDDPQMYVRLPTNFDLWQRWRADARNEGTAPWHSFSPSRNATLVAGLALTLALALAGLWLVCGGRRLLGGTALTLTVLIVVGVSGCPPKGADPRLEYYNESLARPTREADGSLKGEALLQLDEKCSSIQVVVPPEELAALAQAQSEK